MSNKIDENSEYITSYNNDEAYETEEKDDNLEENKSLYDGFLHYELDEVGNKNMNDKSINISFEENNDIHLDESEPENLMKNSGLQTQYNNKIMPNLCDHILNQNEIITQDLSKNYSPEKNFNDHQLNVQHDRVSTNGKIYNKKIDSMIGTDRLGIQGSVFSNKERRSNRFKSHTIHLNGAVVRTGSNHQLSENSIKERNCKNNTRENDTLEENDSISVNNSINISQTAVQKKVPLLLNNLQTLFDLNSERVRKRSEQMKKRKIKYEEEDNNEGDNLENNTSNNTKNVEKNASEVEIIKKRGISAEETHFKSENKNFNTNSSTFNKQYLPNLETNNPNKIKFNKKFRDEDEEQDQNKFKENCHNGI